MIAQDFTFPVNISSSSNNLSHLPPLWRISSINHSDELSESEPRKIRKIFTSFSGDIPKIDSASDESEKMDVLWEDFNAHDSSDLPRRRFSQEFISKSDDEFQECHNDFKLIPEAKAKAKAKGRRRKLELVVKKMINTLFLLPKTPPPNSHTLTIN